MASEPYSGPSVGRRALTRWSAFRQELATSVEGTTKVGIVEGFPAIARRRSLRLDVQIEDPAFPVETPTTNWFEIQRPSTDDTITYSSGRTITPTDIVPGWDAGQPADCVARPASCVTVSLINVPPAQGLSDTVKIYTNTEPRTELTQFGTIDLLFDGFVGTNRDFIDSRLELVDGGKAIRVTLGDGSVAAHQWGIGTVIWNMASGPGSICDGCKVFESLDGTDDVQDREF